MRIIRYILTALLAIAALCSCTHNNGDIGPLFGQWKITDIATTDAATGTVTHNTTSGAFLSFQNDVVTLTQVYDGQHQSALSYGQWELNGNSLTLY
ncbi:MAG: lipocalin-like domain-containing protein, partial [Muribaculaceae bacterium]